MKTEKIIKDATWSGDEKSVNISVFDVEMMGQHKIGKQGTAKRMTIEVGTEIWDDEKEEEAQAIIIAHLNEFEIVRKDFPIE